MKRNRILTGIVCLAALLLTACGSSTAGGPAPAPTADVPTETLSRDAIIDSVVENFSLLAAIPRPSHHEKAISDFFVQWAKDQGLEPVQDAHYNVMFDVPASENMEDYPLGILQVHMDMVVAVADGKDFDPLTDPITVIRDEAADTLTADGTSLGAEDGAGCGIVMALIKGGMAHGPLRIIITTDEEDGMEGAFHMNAAWLAGASYLINIDNEVSSDVLVSTAAGDSVRADGAVSPADAQGDLALNIELSGLAGGHSGVEIDKGRLNALIGLGGFLKELRDNAVSYELASFAGGTAPNAIPAKAVCTIVVSSDAADAVRAQAEAYLAQLQKRYAEAESGITLTVTEADTVPKVVSREDRDNMLRFLTEVIDGVYTWSADMEGLVESSSNLGAVSLNENGVNAATYSRSSVGRLEKEILDSQLALAAACGYHTESVKMADPWPYDPNSRLLALAKEIYLAQNGQEITVSALHAGLECGTFKLLNPELDMISIGPDISDAHTIRETLSLASVPVTWNLLAQMLIRVGE